MKERPIIFSTEMVKAILDGRKTMTRRVIKPQPPQEYIWLGWCMDTTGDRKRVGCGEWGKSVGINNIDEIFSKRCPYGEVGDQLWVKETWYQTTNINFKPDKVIYKSDGWEFKDIQYSRWRSSMFMPHWASRIMLEITGIKVQRLQDIAEEDAIKEGCLLPEDGVELMRSFFKCPYRQVFMDIWNEISSKIYQWDSNPWVWVIEYKTIKGGKS